MTAALVSALTPTLSARGFGWEDDHEWFRRRVGGVQHMLQLLSVDHSPYVHIEPQLMVRHDLVESIFHRTSGYLPEFQADTPTVGGDLHELVPGAPTRFEIGPDGDVSEAARWLSGAIGRFEEYWARMSDLCEIDRALNEHPDRYSPNRPMAWLRGATGLIVAWLVERPDYARLEVAYHRLLTIDNSGFYLDAFTALAEDLSTHTPGELRTGLDRGDTHDA